MRLTFYLLLFIFFAKSSTAQNCAVNAGVDQTICVTQPLTLTGIAGNPQSVPPLYQWSQLSGPSATITSPGSLTTTVTGLTPGNYVFELSNRCADNLLAKDIVAITVLPVPPTALAGADVTQCTNTPGITLNANAVTAPNVGTWSASPAGGTFSPNVNSPNAVYTPPAGSGTYTLTWTISNGFCQTSDNMLINIVSPTATISAGSDINLSCGGSCVTLNGSNQGLTPPQSGLWTLVSGPNTPVIVNPALRNSQVCGLVPGTYTLRWTVSGPCGSGFDEMNIIVANINNAPVSSGATYTNFCTTAGSTTQVLTGTPLTAGETGVWTLTSGQSGVTFTPNNTTANVTANGLTGTFPYTFTWVKTNASGCTATGTHTVHRNDNVLSLSTPADQELACDVQATSFNISYNEIANITAGLTRTGVRITGPAAVGTISLGTSSVSAGTRTDTWNVSGMTTPGTYYFRVEYRNSCGSQYRDIAITVSRSPGIVNAGSDIRLPCNTLTANPIGSASTPGTFTWSQVSGPNTATLSGINTLSLNMSGLVQGVYRMRLSISGGRNCPARSDDMLVIVTQGAPTSATTGPNGNICAGRYRLSANTPNTPLETGTWTVTPSAGVTFSPNANTPNAVVTGLNTNTAYTFTWTVTNACGSIASSQVLTTTAVQAPPVANAGADVCVASGTSTQSLTGNNPSGATITWTALDAGSSVSPTNTQATTATLSAPGTYRFEYALSASGCTTMRDTVVLTRNQAITANAGSDIDICAVSVPTTVTLSSTTPAPSGTTSTWTQLSGPVTGVIASPNATSTLVSNLQPGIYEFEYRIGNGGVCPDVFDVVVVRVVQEPSNALAGPDQSLCNVTTSTTVTLAATAPTVGSGYWQVVSGPPGSTPSFSNQNLATSTVSNLMQGSYTLRWTTTNGAGCADKTDDVVINISVAANARPDVNLCNAPNTQLTGNANTNGTWTFVSGTTTPVVTDNGANETAVVSGLSTGASTPNTYTFRYTLPAAGACPSTFDDMVVTNYPAPSQADAGADRELCWNQNTVTLTGNTPVAGLGSWIRESGPNTPTAGAANTNRADTILNNLIAGLYVYRYEVNTNAACIASVDRVQVIKEVTANAGLDQQRCNVTSTVLNATSALVNSGTWSQVSGPNTATFNNVNAPNAIVSGLIPGTYILRWTVSSPPALGCAANTDDMQIIIDPPVPAMNAGSDVTFCEGTLTPFQIGSPAQAGVTYSWIPSTLLSSATIAEPTFNGVNNAGTYVYTVRGTIGTCEANDQVTIRVNPKPYADILFSSSGCSAVTFNAANAGSTVNSPVYSWNYGAGATPATGTGQGPNVVTYATGTGNKTVTLTITSAEGCVNTDTYQLSSICFTLPVTLDNFTAKLVSSSMVRLDWNVLSAVGFSHFTVERSMDGANFVTIGQKNYMDLVSDYQFDDMSLTPGVNRIYYRLKMTDIDGKSAYSKVAVVKLSPGDEKLTLAPNPAKEFITVNGLKGTGVIRIVDMAGRVVFNISTVSSFASVNLKGFAPGTYVLQYVSEGNTENLKFIKE